MTIVGIQGAQSRDLVPFIKNESKNIENYNDR